MHTEKSFLCKFDSFQQEKINNLHLSLLMIVIITAVVLFDGSMMVYFCLHVSNCDTNVNLLCLIKLLTVN